MDSSYKADRFVLRYGRKYVMIANLCCFIVLELATGFTNNMSQLLGVRALYGIAMGVSRHVHSVREVDTDQIGSSRTGCGYRIRGPTIRGSRYPFWSVPARLCCRVLAGCHLLPSSCPHNESWLEKSVLVWRRTTSHHHHLASLPARDKQLPGHESRARGQRSAESCSC